MNKSKNRLIIITIFILVSLVVAKEVYAALTWGGGEYTNLCGSGFAADFYNCEADCRPEEGNCRQDADASYLFKYTCDGRFSECTELEVGPSNFHQLDAGLCDKTQQIDAFDINCRDESGGWICDDSNLKGYMVWYSGLDGCLSPTPTPTFTPTPTPVSVSAWWQAKDGDIQSNGNVTTEIPSSCDPLTSPCEPFLIAGSPAVPIAEGSISWETSPSDAEPSQQLWVAEDSAYQGEEFKYKFFEDNIPAPTNLGITTINQNTFTSGSYNCNDYDYCYYLYTGGSNLQIDAGAGGLNLGRRRVVLLVDNADVEIKSNIDFLDGVGLLLIVTNQNITVHNSVTSIKGLYVTDGDFNTCQFTFNCHTANELKVRGSVIAWRRVNPLRKLPNNSETPAEVFEFAPDQLLLFPPHLSDRKVLWTEVEP